MKEPAIYTVREQLVMLDRDVADLFDTTARALNQQRARNPDKFPESHAFKATGPETDELRSQIVMSDPDAPRLRTPTTCTAQGAIIRSLDPVRPA